MRPEGIESAPVKLALEADSRQRYWLYVPPAAQARGSHAPLVVSVHGISRNAGAHARALAAAAATRGFVVVAPHFSRRRFPDYQRFGRPERLAAGGRADTMLVAIVRAVRERLSLEPAPLLMAGHSAGAQFVQRFVAAYGDEVGRYVLSAPGSYAWPDVQRRFPHGLGHSARFGELQPRLENLLRPGGLILLGDADVGRDASLRRGPRIDALQGRTRRERAFNYVERLAALSRERNARPPIAAVLLDGCGHAFSDLVRRGHWAEHVHRHLLAR